MGRVSWTNFPVKFSLISLVALATLVPVTSIKLAALREAPSIPQTFTLTVDGSPFTLEAVDVGTLFDCARGIVLGVILRDDSGSTRWSFNIDGPASYLANNGCRGYGVSAASVVGVAEPTDDTAVWVIKVLRCGASCAGYDIYAFRFTPSRASIFRHMRYSDAVFEEVHHDVGLGGVKFSFPRLVLYVNNGYHECPSHWTRITYVWTAIPDVGAQFILTNAVSYESRQCAFSNVHWPPDPGE